MGNGNLKSKVIHSLFKDWDKDHAPLEFSAKTFNQMWKERQNLK
jgi:L-lactate dehydrogenase complex protein LldF